MSDILRKRAMHSSNSLGANRRNVDSENSGLGGEGREYPGIDRSASSSSSVSANRQFEVNTEKGGKRIMSEEEVSNLVHNALRRAREATSSVSPRRKTFQNLLSNKTGSSSAPLSPTSDTEGALATPATAPGTLGVGSPGASTKPPTSPSRAASHFTFSGNKEEEKTASSATTPSPSSFVPGGRRRTSRVPVFVSKYSNPSTSATSPTSPNDTTTKPNSLWEEEENKMMSAPSQTFSDSDGMNEAPSISVDEGDYRDKHHDLSVPTFSSVNSSDAIIRRVEEEIANARRAAQEANRRLAGVSADMNLTHKMDDDDGEEDQDDVDVGDGDDSKENAIVSASTSTDKKENNFTTKTTETSGTIDATPSPRKSGFEDTIDTTPSPTGIFGADSGTYHSRDQSDTEFLADDTLLRERKADDTLLRERKIGEVTNELNELLRQDVLVEDDIDQTTTASSSLSPSATNDNNNDSGRGTSADNVIEIVDADEGAAAPHDDDEASTDDNNNDESDATQTFSAIESASYEEAQEETPQRPAILTAEGNAIMKMLNKSGLPDNTENPKKTAQTTTTKPFSFPGRGRMISTGSGIGSSDDTDDDAKEPKQNRHHEIVDLTNVDSPNSTELEEANEALSPSNVSMYGNAKSNVSSSRLGWSSSQLTTNDTFHSAYSGEVESAASTASGNDPSSSLYHTGEPSSSIGRSDHTNENEEEKKEDDAIAENENEENVFQATSREQDIEVSLEADKEGAEVDIDDIDLQELMADETTERKNTTDEVQRNAGKQAPKLDRPCRDNVAQAQSEAEASTIAMGNNDQESQGDNSEGKETAPQQGSPRRNFWWNLVERKEEARRQTTDRTHNSSNENETDEPLVEEASSRDKTEEPPLLRPASPDKEEEFSIDMENDEQVAKPEDKAEEQPPVEQTNSSFKEEITVKDSIEQPNSSFKEEITVEKPVEQPNSSFKQEIVEKPVEQPNSSFKQEIVEEPVDQHNSSFKEETTAEEKAEESAVEQPVSSLKEEDTKKEEGKTNSAVGSGRKLLNWNEKRKEDAKPKPLNKSLDRSHSPHQILLGGSNASPAPRSQSPGPRAPSPKRVAMVEHRRAARDRDHETRAAVVGELGIHEPKPADNIAERSKKVKFRQRYPVPPKIGKPPEVAEIVRRNQEEPPTMNLILAKPKPELKALLDAVSDPSVQRRSNACGALKVLSTQKKNRLTLVRTLGFLDALVYAASADIPKKDREISKDTRSRAIDTMLNVSGPKDNRVIVFSHPGLANALVKCIVEDKGEARAVACAALATLAKTPYCRPPMAEVPGLVDILAKVLRGAGGKEQEVDYGGDDEASGIGKSFSSDSEYSSSTSSTGSSTRSDDEREDVPKLKSRREQKIQFNTEIAARARINACAALVHLSKSCAVTPLLCANEGLMIALVQVSREYGNPIHTRCLEILCNMTRFPHNNARMAVYPGLVDSLVVSGRAKVDEDRVWSLRTLQNLSSDSIGKNVLANNIVLELLSVSVMRNHADEQVAATATLFNLSTEPGAVVPLTNTKNVVATLVHVAHSPDSSSSVRLMACDALATLGLWLQTLSGAGVVPDEVQQPMPLPSYQTSGWQRWD